MSFDAPAGWAIKPLGDAFTLQRGFDITKAEQRPGRVPVVSSGGITSFHDTAAVEGPGVVIGRKGTLGRVFYLREAYWPHDTTLWVKDFQGSDPRYVYYFLRTFDALRLDVGSANPTLNRNHVHAVEVLWPPRDEQTAIAEVLEALDDKIDSNGRLSSLLAQTFALQFERRCQVPTGEEPPADWRAVRLGDVATLHRDLVKGANADVPYIGLDAMPRGSTVLQEWATANAPTGQAALFERGDILFGKLRPYFKKVGVAPIAGRCSSEILVVRPVKPHLYGLVLGHVTSQRFIEHCVAVSGGTRMPRAEWKDAATYGVMLPPDSLVAEMTELARTLYSRIGALTRESHTLRQIRDLVLPSLVSGRIRVSGCDSLMDPVMDPVESTPQEGLVQ